ncbi:MAG: RAMP superfamily CRISPR-associated protein [Thermoanaerobaculia bacterium]
MEIHYTLSFAEPWRVGSGEAAGAWLDGQVRRDGRGLPFVPGTTVQGLAADALGRLLGALGLESCERSTGRRTERGQQGPPGSLCGVTREGTCPFCALFGSNFHPGAVLWGPARLALEGAAGAEPTAEAQRALAGVRELLFRGRPRTAIERRSGRAEDEHLFALEEVLPDWCYAGRIELPPEARPLHVSLLVAALRMVREIGSGRRRGLGGCRIEIDAERTSLEPAFADWRQAIRELADLEALGRKPAASPPRRAVGPPRLNHQRPALLLLRAQVEGELSVGGRPEAGNLVSGLPYVPGSTLRGALATRWRRGYESEAFTRAFLSGAVQFGFLYPSFEQGSVLPTVASLATCKLHPGPVEQDGHGLYDLLPGREREDCPVEGCGARLVPRVPAFSFDGEPRAIDLALSPHNAIDPASQTVRGSALFAYEALPDGRELKGFLRGESHEALEELLAGLELQPGEAFPLRVGRRKGSLGTLSCTFEPWTGEAGSSGLFPDLGPGPKEIGPGGSVRIDLLTPAIVLDRHLRFKAFLEPQDFGLERPRFSAAFCHGEVLAGWNSAHRLPKGDQIAVVAGSTFRLDGPTATELAALSNLAQKGLGLRTEEGFGQFRVREIQREVEG